jgi:hypothetical protein
MEKIYTRQELLMRGDGLELHPECEMMQRMKGEIEGALVDPKSKD